MTYPSERWIWVHRWWVVALISVVVACGRGGDPTSTSATSALTSTSTTSSPTITTTTTAQAGSPPPILVAHQGGIDLWTPSAVSPLLTGEPVVIAVPDLKGGLVFQRQGDPPVISQPSSMPIMHLASSAAEQVVLIDGTAGYQLSLVQVVKVDSRPTVVYRRWVEDPNDCQAEECRWNFIHEDLVLQDLETGKERVLGTIGSFESSSVEVGFGGSTGVVGIVEYGGESACAGWFPAGLLLDRDEPGWIGAGGPLTEVCTQGPSTTCPEGHECWGDSVSIGIDPGGSTVAYALGEYRRGITGGEGQRMPLLLTLHILDESVADLTIQVAGPGAYPSDVDVVDGWVLVGLIANGESAGHILVDPAGEVQTLDLEGRAVFWHGLADLTS